jgi:Holliday junction resolvase
VTPEGKVEREIFNFLKSLGIFCFKHDSAGVFDSTKKAYRFNRNPHRITGVSDILGVMDGRFLAIEVKSAKGRVSPTQKLFLEHVIAAGGIAFVAKSVNQVALELAKYFPENTEIQRYLL